MKNGFPISQLEIDDKWVTEHGDLTPDPKKFPNMADMTKQLHDMGIKVTIWTHPFFNIESESLQETLPSKTFTDYDDEDKRDYYVKAGQERYYVHFRSNRTTRVHAVQRSICRGTKPYSLFEQA